MTTHALRHHGKFLGHMTEEEANELIDKHVKEGADRHDFNVHDRQRFEIHVHGDLVDTFDREDDANEAADNLAASLKDDRRGSSTVVEVIDTEPDPSTTT